MKTFEKLPRPVVFLVGLSLFAIIGGLDYVTGWELSFSIFYLVPVSLVTWTIGRRSGILAAMMGSLIWFYVDQASGQRYSQAFIPFWNTGVRLGFFLVVAFILAELKVRHSREILYARTDFLTGAFNLRAFSEHLEAEIDRARRHRHPFTLVYLDLDNFKGVNDRFGHQTGDLLLVQVVEIIRQNTRAYDTISRPGGDEFVVLLSETDPEECQAIVGRLHQALTEAMRRKGWPVTFSAGAVTFITPPGSAVRALQVADAEMYAGKRRGKNRIQYGVFSEPHTEEANPVQAPEA